MSFIHKYKKDARAGCKLLLLHHRQTWMQPSCDCIKTIIIERLAETFFLINKKLFPSIKRLQASLRNKAWITWRRKLLSGKFSFNLFSSCLGETFYTCIVWFVFNFSSIILIMKLLRHLKEPVCQKSYSHWSDQYIGKCLKAGNKHGFKKSRCDFTESE